MALKPKLGPEGSEYLIPVEDIEKADYWFEEIKESHELHDGSKKFYHKGYKFRGKLTFNRMPQITYEGLRAEYNRHTELNFIPNYEDYPSTNFQVRWINEWNFVYCYPYSFIYWKGTVELEGTEILSSIPGWI